MARRIRADSGKLAIIGHTGGELQRLGLMGVAEAAPELESFEAFFRANEPKTDITEYLYGFHTRKCLEVLDKAVKDVERGRSRYVALCLPPRHGKSDQSSRRLPAFAMLRRPERSCILASAGDDLAKEFSTDCRTVFRSAGTRLGRYIGEVDQAGNWWTSSGGRMFSVGRGGAPHGHGAHYLILDDPFRNAQEAESTAIRDKAWNSFRRDLMTRLAPHHLVCIVGNRWHERDIVGRIKALNDSDSPEYEPRFPKFDVLDFPAWLDSADEITGQPAGWLFPERFDEAFYEMHKSASSDLTLGAEGLWSAMFLQQPRPRKGKLLKIGKALEEGRVHWITSDDEWPSGLRWRRGWDVASTEAERTSPDPDYSVGTLAAFEPGKLFIRHVRRGRWEGPERNRIMKDLAIEDGPDVKVRVETVAGYKDAFTIVRDALLGVRTVERWNPPKGKKFERATVLEAVFDSGQIYIRRAPWNEQWIDEIAAFPTTGKKDDQVDSLVVAVHADIVKPVGSMSFSM